MDLSTHYSREVVIKEYYINQEAHIQIVMMLMMAKPKVCVFEFTY